MFLSYFENKIFWEEENLRGTKEISGALPRMPFCGYGPDASSDLHLINCSEVFVGIVTFSVNQRWTGLGSDCIRTIANFVEFGFDRDCKSLQSLGTGSDFD